MIQLRLPTPSSVQPESTHRLKQTAWVLAAGMGACGLVAMTGSNQTWWLLIGLSCIGKLDQLWRP